MKPTVRYLCLSGIFAALVFVCTAFLQIPSYAGYLHVGDALIYLAACLLPWPYAMGVGMIGGALADLLTGYAVWAPASLIIKGLSVLAFRRLGKIVCLRNLLALIPAWVLCIGGYYAYEALITQNATAPLAGMVGSLFQCLISSIIFLFLGYLFDKLNLRRTLL